MSEIRIGDYLVGSGQPPFIVAEVGINHNGELEKAFEMIRVAKECGANAVKFQTFKAEEFVGDPALTYTYISQGKQITESMLDMFKRYEFSEKEWFLIKRKCDEEKIIFLSTPQNYTDLQFLLKIGIPAIKVGSDDFTNLPLLKKYEKTGLPIILSCGMANLAEVFETLETVGTFEGYPTILMLCTSQYPTPPEDANLLKLQTLKNVFPELILGYSDHTQGAIAACVAVALGAVLFEKHFTLDNNLPGPDHWFSENPKGLKKWIDTIRLSHLMLGNPIVRPTSTELINIKEFRRVIVAACQIKKGNTFTEMNLTTLRVKGGNGLPPKYFPMLVGKKACKNYYKGEPVLL